VMISAAITVEFRCKLYLKTFEWAASWPLDDDASLSAHP